MFASIPLQVLVFLCLGAPFFLFERRFAAHPLFYRKVVARDVAAIALVALLSIPTGAVLRAVVARLPVLAGLSPPDLPLWLSIPLAVVGSDFAMYWTHRLIHTRVFWPIHRWHHVPRYMYWLGGGRTSFFQGLVNAVPGAMFGLLHVPAGAIGGYAIFSIVANHWMHSNLRLRSPWLEAVFVTPRIHHIHHSIDPRHHGRNFGSLLSIWDRMFGTFVDPSEVTAPLQFGIPEAVSGPRLVVGV